LKKRVGDRLAVLPSPPSKARESLGNASAQVLLKEGKKLADKEINMFTAVNLFKTNASDFITGAAAEALEAYEAK